MHYLDTTCISHRPWARLGTSRNGLMQRKWHQDLKYWLSSFYHKCFNMLHQNYNVIFWNCNPLMAMVRVVATCIWCSKCTKTGSVTRSIHFVTNSSVGNWFCNIAEQGTLIGHHRKTPDHHNHWLQRYKALGVIYSKPLLLLDFLVNTDEYNNMFLLSFYQDCCETHPTWCWCRPSTRWEAQNQSTYQLARHPFTKGLLVSNSFKIPVYVPSFEKAGMPSNLNFL